MEDEQYQKAECYKHNGEKITRVFIMKRICFVFIALAMSFMAYQAEARRMQLYAKDKSSGQWVPVNASNGELSSDVTVNSDVTLDTASFRLLGESGDTVHVTPEGNLNTVLTGANGDTANITNNTLHVYEQFPQRSIFNETTGETLVITSDGEAKVEPPSLSPSNGYTSITISPGNSQTVTFSNTASRVSFNASGASEYRYELNSSSADTNSMIVFEGQYIEKLDGSYDQITFYNLSSNSNDIDISVEPEF